MSEPIGTAQDPPRVPWRHQPALFGMAFKGPHRFLDTMRERYGPVCGMGAGPMRMILVAEPSMLAELFAMPTERFRWNHKFNWFVDVVGEHSMLMNDEPEHRRLRSAVQVGFSRRRLNSWIPMIVERTDAAIDRLPRGDDPVDLAPFGRDLTLEIVAHALFGARLAEQAGRIAALMQNAQDYLARPTPPHRLPFGRQARVRADRRRLDELIDAEMAHHRDEPTGDQLNVLEALVAESALTDAEIRDQVVTLIGAGFDTTAASLAWVLWRAALTEEVWTRLRIEADAVLGPPAGGALQGADRVLQRLELAGNVVRETLRLHPAGAITPREAAVDIHAGGYRIPAGTMIVWSAHLVGRDPVAWPDPLRFDPDRHRAPTPEQAAMSKEAWVPFGGGARSCIGFALAQMELTLILSRMAQRLDLSPTASTVPDPVGVVVNRPAGGVPMRVSAA